MFEITPSGGFYDILPGYFIFFLDGMLEILFIFTSLLFLHTMKLQLSIVTGLIGCVLIGFNNIFMLLIKQSNPQLPNNNFQLSIFYPVGLVSWIIICIIIVKILISKLKENKLNNVNIKKQILELGSQYSRLELRELSEKIGEDNESLKRIVISMIRNNEIFAQYFNNTKTLVLNQQANLEQLEQLISKINTIEKKKRKKIKLFTDKVKNIKFHPILIFKILFILNILCFLVFNFYYFNLFINLPPYFFMIFGGWEGILFFLFLLRYLRLLDPKNSIRYGALGCVALGLNFPYMFYISSIYFWAFDVPLYIRTYFYFWIVFCSFYTILVLYFKISKNIKFESSVRKCILELGTNYTRLRIREITEKTKVFQTTIIAIVKKMIENNEIYAEYFESSRSVAFNLQVNIAEIDTLMGIYDKWESERIGKKSL